MALIHTATLRPTKLELLAGWLPGRDWYTGPAGDLDRLAAYRFDDPAGEVGIETIVVSADDGTPYQVPLTYRAAPVPGRENRLIGTTEHSVLGRRWVYDAVGDPVYAAALAAAVLDDAGQADEYVEVDGRLDRREPTMAITGTSVGGVAAPTAVRRVVDGDPTLVVTDTVDLALARRLDDPRLDGVVLTGTWPGQDTPVPLAAATAR